MKSPRKRSRGGSGFLKAWRIRGGKWGPAWPEEGLRSSRADGGVVPRSSGNDSETVTEKKTCLPGRRQAFFSGAEGETRTRTGVRPLDPEPSASTSSATSARQILAISNEEIIIAAEACQPVFFPHSKASAGRPVLFSVSTDKWPALFTTSMNRLPHFPIQC